MFLHKEPVIFVPCHMLLKTVGRQYVVFAELAKIAMMAHGWAQGNHQLLFQSLDRMLSMLLPEPKKHLNTIHGWLHMCVILRW
jgi:hypothetical protein